MPAWITPLVWPVWCAARRCSRSRTHSFAIGRRRSSSRATARPRMPPPTTTRSHSRGGALSSKTIARLYDLADGRIRPHRWANFGTPRHVFRPTPVGRWEDAAPNQRGGRVEPETITYETDDRVARIMLNRPERGNGITNRMVRALAAALQRANLDPALHAIALSGNRSGFCGGYDLVASAEGEMEGLAEDDVPDGSPIDPAV